MSDSQDGALPPSAAGAAIGALQWFAFATAGKPLGVTTPFESTAAILGQKLAPKAMHSEAYLRERGQAPALDWESALTVGIVLGSHLAARAEGTRVGSRVPELWRRRFGPSRTHRALGAFLGGAVMMVGARMAQGCTSGHGISGTAQLALSSWLFSAVMGATAVAVARAVFAGAR